MRKQGHHPGLGARNQSGQRDARRVSSRRGPLRRAGPGGRRRARRRPSTTMSAGLMLTNPNTLGLFEKDIQKIAAAVHEVGGLLYYDGANFNSIVGVVRPGDMGFDIVHMNLHKTFATPHGGGGPGSGPLAVSQRLERFLPAPVLTQEEGSEQVALGSRPARLDRTDPFVPRKLRDQRPCLRLPSFARARWVAAGRRARRAQRQLPTGADRGSVPDRISRDRACTSSWPPPSRSRSTA